MHTLFTEYLTRLNRGLPTFGAQLSLFPDVPLVQSPLQEFFKDYIECYSVMLVQFASQPTSKPLRFGSAYSYHENAYKEKALQCRLSTAESQLRVLTNTKMIGRRW